MDAVVVERQTIAAAALSEQAVPVDPVVAVAEPSWLRVGCKSAVAVAVLELALAVLQSADAVD